MTTVVLTGIALADFYAGLGCDAAPLTVEVVHVETADAGLRLKVNDGPWSEPIGVTL